MESNLIDLEEKRKERLIEEIKGLDKKLEENRIQILDIYVPEEIQIQMLEMGFVDNKSSLSCLKVKQPYISYQDYINGVRITILEHKVQCPLYKNGCEVFGDIFKDTNENLKPCKIIYKKLKKLIEKND